MNYEYVDENGQVIEGAGNGPPEGYEVVDEVENKNKGRPQQTTAEVVEDVDISGFDIKGNYIGSPVSSNLAQINSKSSKFDQDYEEEEEDDDDDDEDSYSKKGNAYIQQSRYVQQPPKPTKDPYKVIEESYPGIFERLKKSETNQKSNYKSTWNNNEKLNQEFDKAAQSGIARERGWTVGNMNKELDKLVQSDIPESKDKSSWDYYRFNKLAQSSDSKRGQSKNGWNSRVAQPKVKNEWSTTDPEAKEKSGWSRKDPEAQDDSDNKNLNQEMDKLAQSRFDNSAKVIDDQVNITTETPVQHMDIHPGMDEHNKVVIQQLSVSNGTEGVKITEQNILSANNNSTTGAHQGMNPYALD